VFIAGSMRCGRKILSGDRPLQLPVCEPGAHEHADLRYQNALLPTVPAATSPKPFTAGEARRPGLCVWQADAAERGSKFDFFRFIAFHSPLSKAARRAASQRQSFSSRFSHYRQNLPIDTQELGDSDRPAVAG
jgi:hypothetical protein